MWLESLQDDIRRYLEGDIRYEKHGQGGVVLIPGKLEILLETENGCIGDVGAVEEGEQIHETEDRDHAKIDLGDKPALGG